MSAAEADSETERPQLLFFYEPSDGRARRVEGFIAQVLQRRRNHDSVAIRHVDVAKHAALAARFEVHTTPALVVVHEKRVRGRLERPRGCRDIATLLQPWLR